MARAKKPPKSCEHENCAEDQVGRGLCRNHYNLDWMHRNRTALDGRNLRAHPLYAIWHDRKQADLLCESWRDCATFFREAGFRPPNTHLVAPNPSQPIGPENFEWRPHLRREPGETAKAWWARKWATRQAANPGSELIRGLKRRFGITPDDYAQMLAAQDGKCAICREEETSFDFRMGTRRRLAVDHCHTTKKVRGLLCFRCNATLGRLEESVDLLDAMRAYIITHKVANAA